MTVVTEEKESGTGVAVYGGIAPYLMMRDARKAAAFYKETFGAEELLEPHLDDKGRVLNLQLKVNGATLMLMDPMDEYGYPFEGFKGFTLHMQLTGGVETFWQRVVDAGCEVVMPLGPQFWGDTYGQFKDPFGVAWSVGQKT
jgi:PhnB protein